MKCFHCREEITWEKPAKEVRYKMVPIEFPYVNLFFHLDCYKEICNNIIEYLTLNPELVYNYVVGKNLKK